ncbi:type II toxin-antitoxin system RelE/ParE family toxin [Gordonia sp. HY002]|uniref:type II toxin-antitoxin system RelE/ParE family toxin n=1 Tax=Gordonia zhenghanii TaxID=2911516 RepID=UPI001EF08202|nr:type II toxin-antitoxin system RelE/ParE family toxin [Gordonia zhenghanii]MCF8572144.1 type II toxin-antitoxin system RelE/ParE family toxin [Gordonia zhenghanii]MCF8604272.1 type II toxin-antitoxin system RelE/ParE family toxin [Gordonia zhenghanii]
MSRAWEVSTDLIDGWLGSLEDDEFERVLAALEYLAERGPTLGRPFVDTVEGSAHANMKELRPQGDSGRSALRLLFAFDLDSKAVILVAGDKAGNWKKWYSKNTPIADDLLTDHQDGLRRQNAEAKAAKKTAARKGKQGRRR